MRTPAVTGIPPRPKRPLPKLPKGTRSGGFAPTSAVLPPVAWQPQLPPQGTYDPTLDANYAAADRGYTDLQASSLLADTRGLNDYNLAAGTDGTTGVNLQRGYSLADNLRTRDRTNQDYGTATTALGKSYADLGARQGEQAQQAGAVGGGALADALLKRTANQGVQQAGLDTTRNRTLADLLQSDQRINTSANNAIDQLKLGYDRGVWDRNKVDLPKASRELTQFGIDTTTQKGYQASASGLWQAPPKPTNEFKSPSGKSYRVLKGSKGNKFMLLDGTGTIVGQRPA